MYKDRFEIQKHGIFATILEKLCGAKELQSRYNLAIINMISRFYTHGN